MTTLTMDTDDQVALITLNRPLVRNAIDDRMIRELRELADQLDGDLAIRAVILTGSGRAFCSGMDLDYLARSANAEAEVLRRETEQLRDLFITMRSSRLPWIAAVNGPAVAGGAGLASACDLVLADRSHARFGYPEVQIGFIPALVAVLLVARVGETYARDLLLTGRLVKADAAMRMGLVNELAEDGQVLTLAGQRARALTRSCSSAAIAATKGLMEQLLGQSMTRSMELAVEANLRQRMSPACRRGVRAFLNKEELDWRLLDSADQIPH